MRNLLYKVLSTNTTLYHPLPKTNYKIAKLLFILDYHVLKFHSLNGMRCTSSDPFLLVPYLDGSTETGLAAAASIVAHFTTLRARKFMKRAFRICINFCPSSKFVGTRSQSKWLILRAKYCVYWHFSGAKFWVGPRKSNLQP